MPKNSVLKTESKNYIKVKNKFVELKFEEFFHILSKHMTTMMIWMAYKDKKTGNILALSFPKKCLTFLLKLKRISDENLEIKDIKNPKNNVKV